MSERVCVRVWVRVRAAERAEERARGRARLQAVSTGQRAEALLAADAPDLRARDRSDASQ
eukprot:6175639-Pleurochrysis_carterae.AAC.2